VSFLLLDRLLQRIGHGLLVHLRELRLLLHVVVLVIIVVELQHGR
jgi:hypothetical protein